MCEVKPITVKGFKLKPGHTYKVTGETVLPPVRRRTYAGQVFRGVDCLTGNPLFSGGHLPRGQVIQVTEEATD